MMEMLLNKMSRLIVRWTFVFVPKSKKLRIERWLRGREEFRKLQAADCVVVSYGKSGRTWLRVMLSRFYQIKHGLRKHRLLGFDNLHKIHKDIPKIFFTHDNYLKDYTARRCSKQDFYTKKVILLVRDPRDVAVSQYFQWKYRMRSIKKQINAYPLEDNLPIYDFVTNQDVGLEKVIDFMNAWQQEMANLNSTLLIRYEDLRANTAEVFKQILAFIETPGNEGQIQDAVDYSSFEKMKKLEQKKVFWLSGGRMLPKDRKQPNTYKVRRAKVGGYHDYFSDDQVKALDALVDSKLALSYGYSRAEPISLSSGA